MGNEYNEVSKPKHYCEGRKYEPKDVIRDWGLNFNTGSAVKYLSRAGRKGDIIEDLEKAKQFIQFEIDYLKGKRKQDREISFGKLTDEQKRKIKERVEMLFYEEE